MNSRIEDTVGQEILKPYCKDYITQIVFMKCMLQDVAYDIVDDTDELLHICNLLHECLCYFKFISNFNLSDYSTATKKEIHKQGG